jgi:3-hydroxyisobutyrate dehydrogenase
VTADLPGHGQRIGMVGLGAMGFPMAARLVQAGFPTEAVVRRPEVRIRAQAAGVVLCDSVAELAQRSEILGLVVVNDEQVLELASQPDGLLHGMARGSTLIIFSTVRPSTILYIADLARDAGIAVVDAPVAGGAMRAEAGELTVMIGGDPQPVVNCAAIFDAIGSTVMHVGPSGAGAAVKLANNIMANGNQLLAMEAMRLAQAYGIEEETLLAVARSGSGDSWPIRVWGYYDRILTERPDAGTPALYEYLSKDLRAAVDAATERGETLALCVEAARLAASIYQRRAQVLERRSFSPKSPPA